MTRTRMMLMAVLVGALAGLLQAGTAAAQTEDPINIVVVDARGAFISYDTSAIGSSLGVSKDKLPARGLGLELGAHVYPIRSKAIALGIGATLLLTRGTKKPNVAEGQQPKPNEPTIQTKVSGFSPQVSLNFGSRRGYSYISGGIGSMVRTIEATEGRLNAEVTDNERARTLNYGGGARWFAASHLAFCFDVRFYRITAQDATRTSAKLPAQRFFVASAGISVH